MSSQLNRLQAPVAPKRTCPLAATCFGVCLGCLLLAGGIWTAVFTWMDNGRHREYRHYLEPTPYIATTLGATVLISAIVSVIQLVRRRQELCGWLWLVGGVGLTIIGLLLGTVGFYLLTVEIR